MSAEKPLNIVLYWHMHQPQYCDLNSGIYEQPWTYLHAMKDYVDMAAHIEAVPEARAVVNFAPVLLDQIEDYASQTRAFLARGASIRDHLLNALACPVLPNDIDFRLRVIKDCLRANEKRLIDRFPRFRLLADMARDCLEKPQTLEYLSDQFLVDLMMWYHLAWTGETIRRTDSRIQALENKASGFTTHDRREMIAVIDEILSTVLGRYRALAEAGRVELSVTPYAHPIMPLLLNIESALDAMPGAPLPEFREYPGGLERSEWHIREARSTFERCFGFQPTGCWPAEGSVSTPTLHLLEQHGFRWAASGETVLFNSLAHQQPQPASKEAALFQPYHVAGGSLSCFFRDDGLSDLIGFTYADWHADDAIANLEHHLENIQQQLEAPGEHVVSIILDGENAWEYYPENGYYFLNALYDKLSKNPKLNLTTFSDCLNAGIRAAPLEKLVAGSWVYGTFSTWIGDKDKNRGWDMLIDAKRVYDRVMQEGTLDAERRRAAEEQLAVCEGSDWFWWFGDYNPSGTVQDFDHLYRKQLVNLYERLGEEPPEYLAHAFSFGGGTGPAHGGVMRQGQLS